jgi:hypothetical protein
MRRIVFDIETCAAPFDTLSESQKEYILRASDKEKDELLKIEKREDAIRYLSLYPFTAKVIAIGVYDVEKEKSYVYYESLTPEEWSNPEKNVSY